MDGFGFEFSKVCVVGIICEVGVCVGIFDFRFGDIGVLLDMMDIIMLDILLVDIMKMDIIMGF